MNRTKKSAALAFVLCLIAGLFLATPAHATSVYDEAYHTTPTVALGNDAYPAYGTSECPTVDRTWDWPDLFDQATNPYSAQQAEIASLKASFLIALESGRWGVSQQDNHMDNESSPEKYKVISIYWTEDSSLELVWNGSSEYSVITPGPGYGAVKHISFVTQSAWFGHGGCEPYVRMAISTYTPIVSTSDGRVKNLFVRTDHPNYPTGYEGEPIVTQPPPVEVVGMGDSYASGQGSQHPYMEGTETPTNKCRRSSVAYPMLLDADASLNLDLTDFVACGGAKADNVTTGGFQGEVAQTDALTSQTGLVTITITGNDVPFGDFARACAEFSLEQRCTLTGQAYLDAVASIESNVKPELDQLLTAIDAKLTSVGNSHARVLVIGYPQLLPESWQISGCLWLMSNEHPAIRSVTELLNTAIHDKVGAKGGRFEFVSATDSGSPFIGHEICRATLDGESDYFHGVVLGENENDTFHPNALGQQAYAQLVKNYLAQHPLS